MIRTIRWAGLAAVMVALFTAGALADTIYLKNGKTVQGEIYNESSYAVNIKVNGIPRTFYRYEIDHIQKGEAASSQRASAAATEKLTPEKRDLIKRLLEANGARDTMSRIFAQIVRKAPEQSQEKLREILNPDEVIDRLVPIYAARFTTEEIKELLDFYTSPVGAKNLRLTPQIMQDSMKVAAQYLK